MSERASCFTKSEKATKAAGEAASAALEMGDSGRVTDGGECVQIVKKEVVQDVWSSRRNEADLLRGSTSLADDVMLRGEKCATTRILLIPWQIEQLLS